MNKNTNELAAHFLKLAASEFSNHGCNDLEEGLFSKWSDQEKQQFLKDASRWNGENIEIADPDQMPDWMVMDVLAFQLTNTE